MYDESSFTEHLEKNGMSDNTIKAYRLDMRGICGAGIDIKDTIAVLDYVEGLQCNGLTKRRKLNSYNEWLRWNGLKPLSNPYETYGGLKAELPDGKALSLLLDFAYQEIAKISCISGLEDWRDCRTAAILATCTGFGPKMCEVVSMRTGDITKRSFRIGERKIPLSCVDPRVDDILLRWSSYQIHSNFGRKNTPMFPRYMGEPLEQMSEQAVNRCVTKACELCGVERLTVKSIRYAYICEQIRNGVPLSDFASLSGIKNGTTLQRFVEMAERTSKK